MIVSKIAKQFTKTKAVIREGWNEVPELYGTCLLFVIAYAGWTQWYLTEPPGGRRIRYKERYFIVRPDDPKLIEYPKNFITDQHLLK